MNNYITRINGMSEVEFHPIIESTVGFGIKETLRSFLDNISKGKYDDASRNLTLLAFELEEQCVDVEHNIHESRREDGSFNRELGEKKVNNLLSLLLRMGH